MADKWPFEGVQSTVCPKRCDQNVETQRFFFPSENTRNNRPHFFPRKKKLAYSFCGVGRNEINILSAPETSVSNCLSGACSISCDTRFLPISLSLSLLSEQLSFRLNIFRLQTLGSVAAKRALVSVSACVTIHRRMSIDSSGDLAASLSSVVPRQTDQ